MQSSERDAGYSHGLLDYLNKHPWKSRAAIVSYIGNRKCCQGPGLFSSVRELCLAEQGEAGNGVGDVPSADVQLIWKNRLCLPDSCLTTDQTGQRGQDPPSQQSGGTSKSSHSLFKVNYAKNEREEP